MMLQPVIPYPVLVPLALLLTALVLWLAVGACRLLPRGYKVCCVGLAVVAVLAGLALLLNPGYEEERPANDAPLWLVGVDVSASMAAPVQDDAQAPSRYATALQFVEPLAQAMRKRNACWLMLGDSPRACDSAQELRTHQPADTASRVMEGLARQAEAYRRKGVPLAGMVLLTDGREHDPRAWQTLVSRAGAAGCPVHVLPLGSTWQEPDVEVSTFYPLVHSYPGVETRLRAMVRKVRLPQGPVKVELCDAEGKVLQSQVHELSAGAQCEVSFPLALQEGQYTLRALPVAGEARPDNNAVRVTVRAVNSRIRVLFAEGAPYWDSKFLAQYLRAQPVFDVRSVHRLTDKRFYHINSGDDDSTPSETHDMPATAEEFARFDIVVFGKGMEHFLTDDSVAALQRYISENGGVLVLARGRCHDGSLPALDALEPFVRGADTPVQARLFPTTAGVEQGLFGTLLPGAQDEVWSVLPELEDVCRVPELRPQTTVLADARAADLPMLAVMRCGLGAVTAINGEGLWKWDFYPEAREQCNLYRDFWRYYLPWLQTAAEFMPGYDLSLHPDRNSVQQGQPVGCTMRWRGVGRPQSVKLEVCSLADGKPVAVYDAALTAAGALPQWHCRTAELPAGEYLLRAYVPGEDTPAPECRLTVRDLPGEQDNLNADAEAAVRVAEMTGGKVLRADMSLQELEQILTLPAGVQHTEWVYCSLWAKWQVLTVMVLCLGAMWFIRRRKGLP